MYVLDGVNNITMSIDEVCAVDATRLSDPAKFRNFAQGIELDENFLISPRWQHSSIGSTSSEMLMFVVYEMLPVVYSPDVLREAGGSFAIRISGLCEFTLMLTNHRVIAITGLPIDFETSEPVLDFEISADTFIAHCRYLLLKVSEGVLEDDELEHTELSSSQLRMMGMPAGGRGEVGDSGFLRQVSNTRLEGTGKVDAGGDKDLVAIQVFAGKTYTIQLQGSESGLGTLSDPKIYGIFDRKGTSIHSGDDDGGDSLESSLTWTAPSSGVFFISAGAYGSEQVGTYTLSAETDSVDIADSFTDANGNYGTTFSQEGGVAVATGRVDSNGDRDLLEITLSAGTTYEFYLTGTDDTTGSLSDALIYGIYDSNGNQIHSGDDDSGDGLDSKFEYTATTDGVYYISLGGFGRNEGNYNFISKVLSTSEGTLSYDTPTEASTSTGGCPINLYSGCGTNDSTIGFYGVNASYCGKAVNAIGACGVNASFCGSATSAVFGCGFNASAGGSVAVGVFAAAADVWACGAAYTGVFVGGANASACGAALGGIIACGANASLCGVAIAGVSACGANATVSGVSISTVGGCVANAGACGVDTNLPCAADAVACGVNFGFGVDFGVCAVNIFPILPSC